MGRGKPPNTVTAKGVEKEEEEEFFSSPQLCSDRLWGPLILLAVEGALTLGINWSECETDHSPCYNNELYLHFLYGFMAWCLGTGTNLSLILRLFMSLYF
jgi:hypothetical protein